MIAVAFVADRLSNKLLAFAGPSTRRSQTLLTSLAEVRRFPDQQERRIALALQTKE